MKAVKASFLRMSGTRKALKMVATTSAPSRRPRPDLAARTETGKDAGGPCACGTGATEAADGRRFAASQTGCGFLDGALGDDLALAAGGLDLLLRLGAEAVGAHGQLALELALGQH